MRAALMAAALCAALPSAALPCRQALVLGLDVSGSVDEAEYALQIGGLARALDDAEVRAAILSMPEAPVRLAVFEWSGPEDQTLILPPTDIASAAELDSAIGRIAGAARAPAGPTTAIGSAMRAGFAVLEDNADCLQLTLDLSGDGKANTGPRPQSVAVPAALPQITVNGLVIGQSGIGPDALREQVMELSAYYRAYVIRGPGAFVETAMGFEDFEAAMKRKLLRELVAFALSDAGAMARAAQ